MISERQALNPDAVIMLNKEKYKIVKTIGKGTSSIVYLAITTSNCNKAIIKELYPLDLGITRNDDNSLEIPQNSKIDFECDKKNFEKCNEIQRYFYNNDDTANSTFLADCTYEQNNTLYYVMGRVVGQSYDEITSENIESVLEICRSTAKAIKFYHQHNFLHLDIKPANIFVIKETNQLVKLFDFDTLISKNDVRNPYVLLRYTQEYAAPEVKYSKRRYIDERSDLYSIGAILYYRVFSEFPDDKALRPYATFDYRKSKLLKDKSPFLQNALTEIFSKTLPRLTELRYNNADELVDGIDKALALASVRIHLVNQSIKPSTSSKYYISRHKEIKQIRNIHETISNIAYICGIGGIGKSETAREYAHYCTENGIYDTVQLVICKSSLKETIANLNFAGVKDEFFSVDENYDNKIRYIKDSEALNTHRTLIILDNYLPQITSECETNPDNEVIKELKKLKINFLFTTRESMPDYNYCINIGEFNNDLLMQMFFDINSEDKEKPERQQKVDELISVVAGHTLTVDLVAHLSLKIEHLKKHTLDEYIEVIKKSGLKNEVECRVSNNKDEDNLNTTVYNHISRLFRFVELDKEEIYIMTNACLLPLSGMDTQDFCNFIGIEYSSWTGNQSIDNLIKSGWLKEKENTIFMHPVISDVAINELKPDISDGKCLRYIESIELRIENTDNDYFIAKQYLAVALQAGRAVSVNPLSDVKKRATAKFLSDVGKYACKFGLYEKSLENYNRALNVRKSFEQEDLLEIAVSYYELCDIYGYLGNYKESLRYSLLALKIRSELLPEEHIDMINSQLNVGICYSNLSDFATALKYMHKAEKSALKLFAEPNPSTATIYSYLGSTYRKSGDYSKALKYEIKCIEIREKFTDENHLSLSSAYTGIGLTYAKLGEHRSALEYAIKAFEIRRKVLPQNHPYLATALKNIGSAYGNLGDFEKSLEYKLKALDIRVEVLPDSHPYLAETYNDVGVSYSQLGNYEKALEYELKALIIRERILPENYFDLASSYNNVGTSYSKLGEYEKALEFQFKALKIREKVLSENHPDLALSYNNAGTSYSKLGEYEKALEFRLKALKIREKILPENHPDLASSYNTVGASYSKLEEYEKALEFRLKALEIRKKALPENHPDLAISYNNAAVEYRHLMLYNQALDYHMKAVKIYEENLPENSPDLATVYSAAGNTYCESGDCKNALKFQLKALSIRQKTLSPTNPLVAKSYFATGKTYQKSGYKKRAFEYFSKAYEIYQKTLPDNHPDLIEVKNCLAHYTH